MSDDKIRDTEVDKEVQEALDELNEIDYLTDEEKEVIADLIEAIGVLADDLLQETNNAKQDLEDAIEDLEELLKEDNKKHEAREDYDRAMNIFD